MPARGQRLIHETFIRHRAGRTHTLRIARAAWHSNGREALSSGVQLGGEWTNFKVAGARCPPDGLFLLLVPLPLPPAVVGSCSASHGNCGSGAADTFAAAADTCEAYQRLCAKPAAAAGPGEAASTAPLPPLLRRKHARSDGNTAGCAAVVPSSSACPKFQHLIILDTQLLHE